MTKIEALKALSEKVEAGEWSFNGWDNQPLDRKVMGKVDDAYHGSLDAAKALHKSLLPEWEAQIWTTGFVTLVHPRARYKDENVRAEDPARAWLLSILKALIAQEEAA